MPQTYKILGQVFTTPNTFANIYVTGSSAADSAVINSIYFCNQGTSTANVDLIIRPISQALANKHYIVRNQKVEASATFLLNLGVTVGNNTIIAANTKYTPGQAGVSNTSFSAFGIEIT